MRSVFLPRLSVFAVCLLVALPVMAEKSKPSDFPLRVNIVARNGIRHYHGFGGGISSLEEVDGLGQANLFQNGEPLGFDFNYQCSQPIVPTPGFETFMARWKKPGRVIQIVMPVMGGKPGDMNSCDLNVSMKQDIVYVRHNGSIGEEPVAEFKDWMVRHQYDPEHGKDLPVNLKAEQPPAAQSAPAPAVQQ
ncbi:MAG: hypothetical protein WBC92_10915 [Terracidiphilus sp.]